VRLRYYVVQAVAYTLIVTNDETYLVSADRMPAHNCGQTEAERAAARTARKASSWHGQKPNYEESPSHLPPLAPGNGKQLLPADAANVYAYAVPDPEHPAQTWWGHSAASGRYYRFQYNNVIASNGKYTVHFNGSFDPQSNIVPNEVKQRFA
jgi:hypothetical protein